MEEGKEQNVERVFNDCTVMAICKGFETLRNYETSTIKKPIGVEGVYIPKVSLSSISSTSDQTSNALNHG